MGELLGSNWSSRCFGVHRRVASVLVSWLQGPYVASRFYTTHPHDPSIGFRSTGKSKPSSSFSSPSPNSRHVQRKIPIFPNV
jgi:hypothetical protein